MNKLLKQPWLKIETIPKVNYFMLVPIFVKYGDFIAKQGGSDYFRHLLWIFEKGTAILCYLKNDLEKGINFLFNKTVNNPLWAEKLNQELMKYTQKYFNLAKKLENQGYNKLSNPQLAQIFHQLIEA